MPTKAEKTPIRITCSGKGLIARKQLIALQGHLKKISRKNLEKLKNRILKKGFNVPYHLWIDEQGASYILDGHQRTLALMELEAQGHPVPDRLPYDIIEAKDIEDAKDALLGISSQYGEFTLEGLRDFSAGMKLDADLRLPSGEIRLETVRPTRDERGDDDLPGGAPKISKDGDLWGLGPHRILAGDNRARASYTALLAEERAQLVFTDPPYGVDYDSRGEAKYLGGISNDEKRGAELEKTVLAPAFRQAVAHTLDEAAFYIWHASVSRKYFERALTAAGLMERQYIIWLKPWIVMGRGNYHYQHEPCFYAGKGQTTPRWTGDRTQSTTWTVAVRKKAQAFAVLAEGILLADPEGNHLYLQHDPPRSKKHRSMMLEPGESLLLTTLQGSDVWEARPDTKAEYIHPNQKPVELSQRAILNNTEPGEIVLDMFAGSGSTLIGCQRTGRLFRGIEIDKRFVDLIVKRWCLWIHARHLEPEVTRNGKAFEWRRFCPEIA